MSAAPSAPRVRFAPSPTGYFHVGGARTALYNWLFARQHGGTFVLRIEDTDRERSSEEWVDGILEALTWLGIAWDEGPYRQSDRRSLYGDAVATLVAAGRAYACDCTREIVEERTRGRETPGYDGYCRDRGLEPGPGRALRFRVPDDGETVVHDLIRGEVVFANSTIGDFVIVKSNGDPLFVLAVVVDDIEMRITHVIRAEEHLPTTPKAVMIWDALNGGDLPVFAHLPVLVNEQRQKLSKRRDRVAVEDFRAQGFLPEAMVNYLALLGWSPKDGREFLTVDELLAEFELSEVNHSPAFFDERRLLHFNGVYIRELTPKAFIARVTPFLLPPVAPWLTAQFDEGTFKRLATLVQERIATLADAPGLLGFLFSTPFEPDPVAFSKAIASDPQGPRILELARDEMVSLGTWDSASLRTVLETVVTATGRKLGKVQSPIRVATMGSTVGLPLFESLEVLGRERTLERVGAALDRARAASGEPGR